MVKGRVSSSGADIETVPQVTTGPLTVTEGILLSIGFSRECGMHGSTGIEDGLHQGTPRAVGGRREAGENRLAVQ